MPRRLAAAGLLLLFAAGLLPGCAGRAARDGAKPAVTAETEVKPAPPPAPPAAAPPSAPPAQAEAEPARPASPDEQTKQTLAPRQPEIAAATPSKSAPARHSRPSPAAQPATDTAASPAAPTAPSVAVVGDSLAVGVGMALTEQLKARGGPRCQALGKISTGLISRRFFDWDKRLAELVAQDKPMAVVVVMGGNDANNGIAGAMAGSPAWAAAYREKARHFIGLATSAGVPVVWLGLPAMRDPDYAARVRAVNAAGREACAAVAGCVFLEAGDAFVDAAGNYVTSKTLDGRSVCLRGKDGVHLTMTGYGILGRRALDRLAASGVLPPR